MELKSKELKSKDDTGNKPFTSTSLLLTLVSIEGDYEIPSTVAIKLTPEKDGFLQLQENPAYGVTNYKQ